MLPQFYRVTARCRLLRASPQAVQGSDVIATTEHIEHVSHMEHTQPFEHVQQFDNDRSNYPIQDSSIADDALPFIPTTVVKGQRNRFSQGHGRAWIVVNNIVYDCKDFIQEHPGGDTVIRSFVGEDCSWQFWRFHSKKIMDQWGRTLRVGRTEGIENRFAEPPRFFGSRGLHKLH